jgi:hypothetical protein
MMQKSTTFTTIFRKKSHMYNGRQEKLAIILCYVKIQMCN